MNSAVDGANTIITIFEPLLIINENNEVIGGQAESWEASEDGLTWTFTMKDGLKWSDGSDLTEALASRNQEPVSQTTFDSLTERFNMLLPLEHIASEINRCILSENEYADDASSGLKNIRREIRLTNDKLSAHLQQALFS